MTGNPSILSWRRSTHSTKGGTCVEAGCRHHAPWRKSTHSNNGSDCLEAADFDSVISMRDSKLGTTGGFPSLSVPVADWDGLLADIRYGRMIR